MTKRNISDLLPLLILIGALAYSVITFGFRVDYFSIQLLAGLSVVMVITLTYFFWKRAIKTALGITLILGTVNFIQFLPFNVTFGGGLTFNALGTGFLISIQLFAFSVLLIFYIHQPTEAEANCS